MVSELSLLQRKINDRLLGTIRRDEKSTTDFLEQDGETKNQQPTSWTKTERLKINNRLLETRRRDEKSTTDFLEQDGETKNQQPTS
jgi:hypothetical protein